MHCQSKYNKTWPALTKIDGSVNGRLAVLAQHAMKAEPPRAKLRRAQRVHVKGAKLAGLLAESTHSFRKVGKAYLCRCCKSRVHTKDMPRYLQSPPPVLLALRP